MNKTNIEWCDYTWNPVVGCKRGCSYCYAKRIFSRFHKDKKFEKLQFYSDRLNDILPHNPAKIFVGSMSDICFWERNWMRKTLDIIKQNKKHTFMFLTKDGNVYKHYKFPDNCWLGITYTKNWVSPLMSGNWTNRRYLSIEPLLDAIDTGTIGTIWDLVIIGGKTPNPCHTDKWVKDIIDYCKKNNLTYLLKSNLHYSEMK